ncbi:hypothetical protein MTO96_009710 [Rhipicephalus appendiculatus]
MARHLQRVEALRAARSIRHLSAARSSRPAAPPAASESSRRPSVRASPLGRPVFALFRRTTRTLAEPRSHGIRTSGVRRLGPGSARDYVRPDGQRCPERAR